MVELFKFVLELGVGVCTGGIELFCALAGLIPIMRVSKMRSAFFLMSIFTPLLVIGTIRGE